jgi:hypothetical protein
MDEESQVFIHLYVHWILLMNIAVYNSMEGWACHCTGRHKSILNANLPMSFFHTPDERQVKSKEAVARASR